MLSYRNKAGNEAILTKAIVFLLVILSSCNQSAKKYHEETAHQKATFDDYITVLPVVKIPLSFNSDANILDTNAADTVWLTKFPPPFLPYGQIYGKLPLKSNYHAVIYLLPIDLNTPAILTYDKQGNKIDSLMLFSKLTNDVSFDAVEKVMIDSNHQITIIDSIMTWQTNKEGSDRISGSGKLSVISKTFQIQPNGRIMRKSDAIK
ncbi:MAG: hypothetical protein MUD08_10265 [Cytophagales bacterium]|jgi:hypothetical protein|nr:hypothetical protein [Cytophagales bacterium]